VVPAFGCAPPLRIGPPAPLAELLARTLLILPTQKTALRGGFDALVARLGVTPAIAAEVDDTAMMRLLACEDAGLAVIPPIVVRDELAAGMLAEVRTLAGLEETFYAVTLERCFPNVLAG
jgi:LysR family transcriptional regulator, transcriptional activator of nhaA